MSQHTTVCTYDYLRLLEMLLADFATTKLAQTFHPPEDPNKWKCCFMIKFF
uniref:Uncharacterized protein n=1 Tax=Anguilla anguilla TaxID=7936 RepID=A0A0E9VUQ0_ANGAN